jgi:anthranilate synthase/aminodeoxychorismate synthase-like glutamine amidotransferase
MNAVLIDNYDSFTYNLVPILYAAGCDTVTVMRNDEMDVEKMRNSDALIISPGPGLPASSGDLLDALSQFALSKPIFGVCLGLQAIAEHFGGKLINMGIVVHGKTSNVVVTDTKDPIYAGVESPFVAGRYHSWVADRAQVPDDLVVTATDGNGTIMSLRHHSLPVFGVQYHPESVMTPCGARVIDNFIKYIRHA